MVLLAVGLSSEAQQPTKVPRIGYLSSTDPAAASTASERVRLALRELGYIEGQNIAFEYRYAEGKRGRESELAAELVRLKVDLIVTAGMGPALAAKSATTTIPIVLASSTDPVGAGLVASLARPGGNVTGFSTSLGTELNTKRLEMLKDAVPKLAGVGLLRRSAASASLQLKELRAAAVALKLKLEEIETQVDPKGLESAFQTAKLSMTFATLSPAAPSSVLRCPAKTGGTTLPLLFPIAARWFASSMDNEFHLSATKTTATLSS